MVDPLFAQPQAANVTQAIQQRKGFAVFEHTGTVIRQRRRSKDVKIIFDLDYIFQN
jgi:hypothetical protein